ncbi:heavy-metal-associated domain-containing protein [Sphingorhabdus arenilitoris]|uniref:Heavy-metal-associated domain-containing protein n=1 Tax=Sphingorhabdus arenilitoris TaxID=1490041 RepID=A0ABV8RGP6_9SPHN
MKKSLSKTGRILAIAAPVALLASAVLLAQIEGPKRGIAPIASTGDFEVEGIEVEGKGDNAEEARRDGWEQAQRLAWEKLWQKNRGGSGGGISDSVLDGIVSAIVVEEEQIGPRRYVARLGVVFDRARAGQILGVRGVTSKSAPLMILPVMIDGGAPIVYEQRNAWQNAWAKFRTSESRIDYIRPSGAGGESLLLNAGQVDRRSRIWWRTILEQFGAADVIMPIVRIERSWPGGPVKGIFSARYGPDNKYLSSFTLQVSDSKGIPGMMAQGVQRLDGIYQSALAAGRLRSESSLVFESDLIEEEDLEKPAPPPTTEPSPGDGEAATLQTEPLDVLDRAVRDISGQAAPTPAPAPPPQNRLTPTPAPPPRPAPAPARPAPNPPQQPNGN